MRKRKSLLLLLFSGVFLLTLGACEKNPAPDPGAETSDPEQGTEEPGSFESVFADTVGIENRNGVLSQCTEDGDLIAFSKREYGGVYSLETMLTFAGSGGFRLYFDAVKDDAGGVKRGSMLQIDAGLGKLTLYAFSSGKAEAVASCPYALPRNGSTKIRVECAERALSVFIGEGELAEAPVLNIRTIRPDAGYIGFSFRGTSLVSASEPVFGTVTEVGKDSYSNPILDGIADPTALYYQGSYYLFATGSFECRVSEDLVHYRNIGAVADQKTLYGHKYFGGQAIFERDGVFYLFYTTYREGSDTELCICVAVSDSVTGPYTQEGQTLLDEKLCVGGSAGAFVFFDPQSQKNYLYWYTTEREYGNLIYGAELTIQNRKVQVVGSTKKRLIYPTEAWEKKEENGYRGRVCERPNVLYHNGYYYLFYAGSHYATSYGEGYAVSSEPLGSFEKYSGNPILSSTVSQNGVGCTWVVPSPDGTEYYVLYHSHYSTSVIHQRRLCLDRLGFYENPKGGADIAMIYGPTVTAQPLP